jgi:hypothetical protein
MTAVLAMVLLLHTSTAQGQQPLLVVVEAGADEVVEVTVLREAIAHELGVRVLSPADEAPGDDVAIMTVMLATNRAVVTYLRGHASIRRDIELPSDRRRRLQLVTWLAGNIVRDQTDELLGNVEARVPTPLSKEARAEAHQARAGDRAAPTTTAPVPPARVPPPPVAPTAVAPPTTATTTSSTTTTSASAPAPVPIALQGWTIAGLYGNEIADSESITCNCGPIWATGWGTLSELEIAHSDSTFTLGATLFRAHGQAEGLLLGWSRRWRPWLAPEVTAAAGLWSIKTSYGQTSDLFVKLTAGFAVSPAPWLDVLARLSVQNPMSSNDYVLYASAGLRYRLNP